MHIGNSRFEVGNWRFFPALSLRERAPANRRAVRAGTTLVQSCPHRRFRGTLSRGEGCPVLWLVALPKPESLKSVKPFSDMATENRYMNAVLDYKRKVYGIRDLPTLPVI